MEGKPMREIFKLPTPLASQLEKERKKASSMKNKNRSVDYNPDSPGGSPVMEVSPEGGRAGLREEEQGCIGDIGFACV